MRWAFLVGVGLVFLGCSEQTAAPATPAEPPAAATPDDRAGGSPPASVDLVQRGDTVYHQVCIACHGFDPNQAGSIGPAIAGSSLELLRAKVLRNEYPPGYTPKRETRNMVPLPHLEKDLPALAAYLASAEAS